MVIKIVGGFGERFLNQAAMQNIYLWDVKRIDENLLYAKIGIKSFYKLRNLARNTQCKILIIEKKGIVFSIAKLKKRKSLIIGAIFFVIALYFLGSFIWIIEVEAEDNKLKESVIEDLRKWGLKEGTIKYKIDQRVYVDRILEQYNDVAWAQIYITGSKAVIELVKKQLPPELEENIPCDIIASKDGIIEEILPLKGEVLVKPGDIVSKGDILISGKIKIESDEYADSEQQEINNEFLVSAKGIIKARTWHQKTVKIPLVKESNVTTGKYKRSILLQFGKNFIDTNFKGIQFSHYNTKIEKEYTLLPDGLGNVNFSVIKYSELKTKKEFLGVEGASRVAEKQLLEYCKKITKDREVLKKHIDFTLNEDEKAVIASLTIEFLEDIGIKVNLKP